MSVHTASKPRSPRRVRPGCLLGALLILAGSCCFLLLRPRDRVESIEPSQGIPADSEDRIRGLNPEEIEAAALDVVGDSIELGLVLGHIRTETDLSGRTLFEAELGNVADFPVAHPRVVLRLYDRDGDLVETVTLVGELAVLPPGGVDRIKAEFDPIATLPRIVEETIGLSGAQSPFFGVSSYEEIKQAPGYLWRVAELLPFISYSAIWTDPTAPWASYEIQFRIDGVLRE